MDCPSHISINYGCIRSYRNELSILSVWWKCVKLRFTGTQYSESTVSSNMLSINREKKNRRKK